MKSSRFILTYIIDRVENYIRTIGRIDNKFKFHILSLKHRLVMLLIRFLIDICASYKSAFKKTLRRINAVPLLKNIGIITWIELWYLNCIPLTILISSPIHSWLAIKSLDYLNWNLVCCTYTTCRTPILIYSPFMTCNKIT